MEEGRDSVSQLKLLPKCIFVYMRGGPALLGWILLLRSSLGGLVIFHIPVYTCIVNTLKRAGPPRKASKSKLHTDNKVCLGQHFFG